MKIIWSLDRSEPLDAADILGNIALTDENNVTIKCKDTFIDSWFSVLMEGLISLSNGESIKIQIPEEPYPLIFRYAKNNTSIQYADSTITLNNIDRAIKDIKKEMKRLDGEYIGQTGYNENVYLAEFKK